MSYFRGFFTLKTSADLLEKLKHDLARIERDLLDSYAVFDFFVTAEHILDWKYPDKQSQFSNGKEIKNESTKNRLRAEEPLLRVTSHLANGAKHFEASDQRHKSVDDVHSETGYFDPEFFDRRAFDVPRLVVKLKGKDATIFGDTIDAVDLAEKVLRYWETHIDRS